MASDVLEFYCELQLDMEILQEERRIPYKYCVLNSKRKDVYEFLHGAPGHGPVRNRSLLILKKETKQGMLIHNWGETEDSTLAMLRTFEQFCVMPFPMKPARSRKLSLEIGMHKRMWLDVHYKCYESDCTRLMSPPIATTPLL